MILEEKMVLPYFDMNCSLLVEIVNYNQDRKIGAARVIRNFNKEDTRYKKGDVIDFDLNTGLCGFVFDNV